MKTIALVQTHAVNWNGTRDASLNLAEGHPVILTTLAMAAKIPGVERVVLVATTDPVDDVYEGLAKEAGVTLYRGDVHHVGQRLMTVMEQEQADAAVCILGLHPCFNTTLAGMMLETLVAENLDLVQPVPNFPSPLSSTIFRAQALQKVLGYLETLEKQGVDIRGHIAKPFSTMLEYPEQFHVQVMTKMPELYTEAELRSMREFARHIYVEESQNVALEKVYAPVSYMQNRYRLAAEILPKPAKILDIACGRGFGTEILAKACGHVVGGDLNTAVIEENQRYWQHESGMSFETADAQDLPFDAESFDGVTSMETIEHVEDMGSYLAEISRVLKPHGYFICSTPQNIPPFNQIPYNPWHVREMTNNEFRDVLSRHFTVERIYGVLNGLIRKDNEEGTSMIAVCRKH